MRNVHPFYVILFGLLIVSVGFNILQKLENDKLQNRINDIGVGPLIINVPEPPPYQITPPNNTI